MAQAIEKTDILVLGSGSFAGRIVLDLAATAPEPTRILIAGRNPARLDWLRTAANARAVMFGRPACASSHRVDLAVEGAAADVIGRAQPAVVVQAASFQTASIIQATGNGWAKLVAEGGLSATAVFQALLSSRVARAIQSAAPKAHHINCCFADVTNGLIAAMGLPVTCGIGNVAILSNALAGASGFAAPGRLQMLAHYQSLGPWRRPSAGRSGPTPRVWIDGAEISDIFERFASVQLTPEPVIDISGASGVPLMLALAHGRDWRGHVPGPDGLPGGYPVALKSGRLGLDLPPGLGREEAIQWNVRHEEVNGMVVEPTGRVRYTGRLHDGLNAASPALAAGFHVRDLEAVHVEMQALRTRLQGEPG